MNKLPPQFKTPEAAGWCPICFKKERMVTEFMGDDTYDRNARLEYKSDISDKTNQLYAFIACERNDCDYVVNFAKDAEIHLTKDA